MRVYYFLLILAILVTACKSSKKALVEEVGALPPLSTNALRDSLHSSRIDAEWFSAKMRIDFDTPDERKKFTSYIRIRKDSIIWMNIKKVSVEAARILITPDSVFLIDRINKEYAIAGFDLIEQRMGMPIHAHDVYKPFNVLQDMLLGNLIEPKVKWKAGVDSTFYHLQADDRGLLLDFWADGVHFQPRKIAFTDLRRESLMMMTLDDYATEEGQPTFAYHRLIELFSPDMGEVDIDIQFSKVEFDEVKSTPFRIPDHYIRVER